MFARCGKTWRGLTCRWVVALGLALGAGVGVANPLLADYPIMVRSYAGMPTCVTVLPAAVLMPTSFVVVPATYVRHETLSLPVVSTVSWLPGITYLETAEWFSLEMPCGLTVIEAPVVGTTVTESPILSTPQSKSVEELPVESFRNDSILSEPTRPVEPPLTHGKATPPGLPELPGESGGKPGESPSDQAPAAKPVEPNPADENAPAAKAVKSKEDDIPLNLPSRPVNPLPTPKGPVSKEPARTEPEKSDLPSNPIPLPGGDATKSTVPFEPPPAAPAEESRTELLVAPGELRIPLPDTPVLDLSPVPDTVATADTANPLEAETTGKSGTSKTSRSLPEISHPVEDPKPLNAEREDAARPVAPLPESPLPGALPPAKEVEDGSRKPLDPQAVKVGDSKPGEGAGTQKTKVRELEARRPVIVSQPGGVTERSIAELEIVVRSGRSGSPENGVTVYFHDNASGERLEAVTDGFGRARVVVPQGAWEVEVASAGGRLYVLGDVISRSGRLTTASGRDLPRLEIDR